MIMKCNKERASKIVDRFVHVRYHEKARIVVAGKTPVLSMNNLVYVTTAGASNIPVAKEATVTAETLGSKMREIYDFGVSKIHHLLSNARTSMKANTVAVAADIGGRCPR